MTWPNTSTEARAQHTQNHVSESRFVKMILFSLFLVRAIIQSHCVFQCALNMISLKCESIKMLTVFSLCQRARYMHISMKCVSLRNNVLIMNNLLSILAVNRMNAELQLTSDAGLSLVIFQFQVDHLYTHHKYHEILHIYVCAAAGLIIYFRLRG